jgi:uncharacterized protein (DUF1697 family)
MMGTRGRASVAQIEMQGTVALVSRPNAPLDLTPEETDEWGAIADAMPADWFTRETHGLLKQYCRHIIAAKRVAQLIDQEMARDDMEVSALDKLLGMQARETAAIKTMAAAMRVSQQASYTTKAAGTSKTNRVVKRPWET